jgi:hypothetical protein
MYIFSVCVCTSGPPLLSFFAKVVEEMLHFGLRPKLKTLTALLGVCGAVGLPKEA